jgi:hypothetical protein
MEDEDFEGSEFMSESDFDDAASTSTFAKAMRSQLLARADEDEPALTREDMEEIMDEFLDSKLLAIRCCLKFVARHPPKISISCERL